MEQKYLWPLVGVFLGWLLTVLTTGWKARSERRKLLGKILAHLLRIHSEINVLRSAAEHIKDMSGNWEKYEHQRQRMSAKHFLEPKSQLEKLLELIEELSGFSPIEAVKLESLMAILSKEKDATLSAASKNPEVYIRLLSSHEVGLELCESEIVKTIKRLALRHGIGTLVRVLIKLKTDNKRLAERETFMQGFLKETFDKSSEIA